MGWSWNPFKRKEGFEVAKSNGVSECDRSPYAMGSDVTETSPHSRSENPGVSGVSGVEGQLENTKKEEEQEGWELEDAPDSKSAMEEDAEVSEGSPHKAEAAIEEAKEKATAESATDARDKEGMVKMESPPAVVTLAIPVANQGAGDSPTCGALSPAAGDSSEPWWKRFGLSPMWWDSPGKNAGEDAFQQRGAEAATRTVDAQSQTDAGGKKPSRTTILRVEDFDYNRLVEVARQRREGGEAASHASAPCSPFDSEGFAGDGKSSPASGVQPVQPVHHVQPPRFQSKASLVMPRPDAHHLEVEKGKSFKAAPPGAAATKNLNDLIYLDPTQFCQTMDELAVRRGHVVKADRISRT